MQEENPQINDGREAEQVVDEQSFAYFCCNKEERKGENDFNAIEGNVAMFV